MNLSGLLLGVINIAIVIVVMLLVGVFIWWFLTKVLKIELDARMEQLYLILVGLIALYMLVALVFGMPSVRLIGDSGVRVPLLT